MATYDEQGNLLDEAPGLGFASAPGTQIMAPPPALQGDAGVAESMGFTPTQTSGMQSQQRDASPQTLGFASPEPQGVRTQSDRDYIDSIPDSKLFAGALVAVLTGGKINPIEDRIRHKRQEDQDRRADLTNTIDVIRKGTEILRKMPEGMARDAVAAQLGKAVGGGDMARVFASAGSQTQEIKSVLSTFSDPDVQTQLLKACSGSGDFRACVMTQARDKDFMDRAHSMADSKRVPGVVRKLAAISDQIGKTGALDQYKGEDGKYAIPFAKLIELNDKAKIFTPEEMDTIRRNEGMLSPFGIKTTKAIEAGDVERAKQAQKPTKEDFKEGATRRVFDPKGREVQQEMRGGEWVEIGARKDKPTDKPLSLAQERADEQVLAARHAVAGIDKAELIKKRDQLLPNGKSNPDYDPDIARQWRQSQQPLFADVKAKRDGKVAPKAAPIVAPKPAAEPKAEAPAADKVSLASWEKTKKIHGLSDAELEKRLGRKKPAK